MADKERQKPRIARTLLFARAINQLQPGGKALPRKDQYLNDEHNKVTQEGNGNCSIASPIPMESLKTKDSFSSTSSDNDRSKFKSPEHLNYSDGVQKIVKHLSDSPTKNGKVNSNSSKINENDDFESDVSDLVDERDIIGVYDGNVDYKHKVSFSNDNICVTFLNKLDISAPVVPEKSVEDLKLVSNGKEIDSNCDGNDYLIPQNLTEIKSVKECIVPIVTPSIVSEDIYSFINNSEYHSDSFKISSKSSVESNSSFVISESSNGGSDALAYWDENINCIAPLPEQIDAISTYLRKIEKENLVKVSSAEKVVSDLNQCFWKHLDGVKVSYYGSHYSGLAITTSNINICLQADMSVRNSLWPEVHKVLQKELRTYHVSALEVDSTPRKTKVSFIEPYTKVECELAYLGRSECNVLKMSKLLKILCMYDPNIKTLLIAARFWAEVCTIDEFEDGKLHPIAFAILVIHFLQHYEKPVLPSLQVEKAEFLVEKLKSFPKAKSALGELWREFLKYYAVTFNWKEHVVTVTENGPVSKASKHMEKVWIVIEDPFTKKNVAESVKNVDTANFIQSCFKAFYKYMPSSSKNDSGFLDESKDLEVWNYSFRDCDFYEEYNPPECEECEEFGTCVECAKKEYQPVPEALPDISKDKAFLNKVDKVLLDIYDEYMLSDNAINGRKAFVEDMEKYIQQRFKGATLALFGSSVNGFGFKKSDLDISMTLKGSTTLDQEEQHRFLKHVCRHLRKDTNFTNVFLIHAEIPIVKFQHPSSGFQGDISLGNLLAVHNTKLLHAYSSIDKRCRILGCALKFLSKKTQLANTALKALSSYSYLIMVIFYLQQIDPPILPVLQDSKLIFQTFQVQREIVDDWNVWFFKDLERISALHDPKKNDKTAGQLWIGLLDYLVNFDNERVISIRQKEPVPVEEKKRRAALFNIEDPFILSKNLGCVLSQKNASELRNVLHRARVLFGNPKNCPKELDNLKDYFFSISNLTGRLQKEK